MQTNARSLGVAALFLVATTLASVPGTAAADERPLRFRDSYCLSIPEDPITYCYENWGFVQTVITPNGVLANVATGGTLYTEYDADGEPRYSNELRYRTTTHRTVDGALDALRQFFVQETTSFGVTCTQRYDLFLVNGEILFERTGTVCE
ncbi:hypothetical protein [Sandaracinus amylolyticus]|uniref:hypothetical protein n=1 Tax=Sandaracinus amylolyticus TaxID=927083 RepID=UPI001F25B317|nr:hypothetical protein [Sandaracinus amylolyticus]UJR81128.1 Hypothetical protein I5071_31800 [Sandaracinus amylolyticus]